MDDKDWMRIRKNFVLFTKTLNVDNIIPFMYQDWIISDAQMNKLSAIDNSVRRVSCFLDEIRKKKKAYSVLCTALQETQPDLLKKLQETKLDSDPTNTAETKESQMAMKEAQASVKNIVDFTRSLRIQAQVAVTMMPKEETEEELDYIGRHYRPPKILDLVSVGHEHCDRCYSLSCKEEPAKECQVVCCTSGCGIQLHKCKMEDHLHLCRSTKVHCAYVHPGCLVVLPRAAINSHIQTCEKNERMQSFSSTYRKCDNGCDVMLHSFNQEDHNVFCKQFLVPCPNKSIGCPYEMPYRNVNMHMHTCPASTVHVPTMYTIEKKDRNTRYTSQIVRRSEISHHMDLLRNMYESSHFTCPMKYLGCSYKYVSLLPLEPSGKIVHDDLSNSYRFVPNLGGETKQDKSAETGGTLKKFQLNKQAVFNTAKTRHQHKHDRVVSTDDTEFVKLPLEILQHIIRLLDSLSISNLSMTCSTLRDACMTLLAEKGLVDMVWNGYGRWKVTKIVRTCLSEVVRKTRSRISKVVRKTGNRISEVVRKNRSKISKVIRKTGNRISEVIRKTRSTCRISEVFRKSGSRPTDI